MSLPPSRRRWKRPRKARQPDVRAAPEDAAEVRELLSRLEKVEKTASLYPPGAAVLRDLTEDLFGALTRVLGKIHVLELFVGAEEIEWEGEVVYDGTRSDRSLAHVLEDGGVRRLVFLEGIDRGEVASLIEALREARALDAEDLTTLLWQRGLRHVSYATVDFFHDARTDAALERLDLATAAASLVDRLRGREMQIEQIAAVRAAARTAPPPADEIEIYSLTPAETAEIQRRIADCVEESGPAPFGRLLLALIAATAGGDAADEDAVRDRLATLQTTLASLLEDGDLAAAAEIVTRVRALADAQQVAIASFGAKLHLNSFRAFLSAAARREVGAKLAERLARVKNADARPVVEYIHACGKQAFLLAAELLGATPFDRQIVQSVADLSRADFAYLRDHAVDLDPKVAGAAVRVLAEVAGDAGRQEYYRASLHKDPGVRREAFVALARCKDARALDRLIEAFDDPDPEIRQSALRAFAASLVKPRPEIYGRVLSIVTEARFDARPASEQESIFAILGRADPSQGVPYLESIIGRFALFYRERVHRQRLAAIAALAEVATRSAEEVLRRTRETTKSDEIRAACRAALDRLELVRLNAEETSPADRSQVLRALESSRPTRRRGS